MTKRLGQGADESAIDYLRRVVHSCDYESEGILNSLPSVEAVLDYFDLVCSYDTEFWSGVLNCIAAGEDSKRAIDFVAKHNLNWVEDIRHAESERSKQK